MKGIDEFEKWPEIGSRAGAVKSCVSLLSAVCGQPETVMERWLDLYYQVRHVQEKADAAARAAERLKEMAPPETAPVAPFQAAAPISAEDDGQMSPASAENDEASVTGLPQSAAPTASSECHALPARQNAPPEGAPRAEPEPLPETPPENRIKRPGGKETPRPSQIGNTRGHDAAVFKRQVRDRLEAARKKGVSAPELVRAAGAGTVKEDDIYMILQGHVIKIAAYRALDEALRHFEN